MTDVVLGTLSSTKRDLAYVLDDEKQVGSLVSRMLASLGFDAQAFSTVSGFFTEIRQVTPALVIVDLALDQADAIEVMHHLEGIKYTGNILLVSGRDNALLNEARRIGENHGLAMLPTLAKPFRAKDLEAAVYAKPVARSRASEGPTKTVLTIDLAEALARKWIEVWYQPKIDMTSLRICGAEALVRARHPDYGVALPSQLLPSADDPLMVPLSNTVMAQAMAAWSQFSELASDLKVSVNITVSVLSRPDFVHIVRQCIPRQPFSGLILEVTESELIRDPALIREVATRLKIDGIGLSVDDFGTAYSSLGRLCDLPFIELKLDRSFVSGCATDEHKRVLCRAAIDIAHEFHASACAEGIEDAKDLEALVALKCDTAQGFLFAKPMPAADFTAMLRGQRKGTERSTGQASGNRGAYADLGAQAWPTGAALSRLC